MFLFANYDRVEVNKEYDLETTKIETIRSDLYSTISIRIPVVFEYEYSIRIIYTNIDTVRLLVVADTDRNETLHGYLLINYRLVKCCNSIIIIQ